MNSARTLGEHKPGRIKPGRIKRAALSLQNQNLYILCFLLGETSQRKATTGSPNFHGALGALGPTCTRIA